MQIRRPNTDGLELIRPPVWYAQRMRPLTVLTANRRPSVAPKYAVLSITTRDDSPFAATRSCHNVRPFDRAYAVTVPPAEDTISRSPAIADVDRSGPEPCRFQITLPVRASIAYVRPW